MVKSAPFALLHNCMASEQEPPCWTCAENRKVRENKSNMPLVLKTATAQLKGSFEGVELWESHWQLHLHQLYVSDR